MLSVVLIYFYMKILNQNNIPYIDTSMYTSSNSMKLSKNVISGCNGNHFIKLSRANLAFFVLLLGNNLRHGVNFFDLL